MSSKASSFYVKKIFKVLAIIIVILLALVILLSVVAKIKEKEIADIALRKIGRSINAPLLIDDISLSLIRRFPRATIELKGVLLGSPDALSLTDTLITDEETIASIEKIYLSVLTRPLFRGEFEIMQVEIDEGYFSYIVDTLGISNLDFLINSQEKDSTDTTSAGLDILLKELILTDIRCNYIDSLNMIRAQLEIPETEISGIVEDEYMKGSAKGALHLSNCSYKATNLYFMQATDILFDASYAEDTVEVKELMISTDGADINISGNAVIKDTIVMDILIRDSKIRIGEVIKYVPKKTIYDLGLVSASGLLNINATVKGFVVDSILPEVKAQITMNDGNIEMSGYPAVENITFYGNLSNGKLRNNETTSLTIRKFHAETENSSIEMSGSFENLDKIKYDIHSDMSINLGEFKDYIPDTILYDIKGIISASISSKGVLPDSIGTEYFDYLLKRSKLDITLNNLSIALDSSLFLESISGKLGYDFYHFTARDLQVRIPLYNINLNNSSFDSQFTGSLSDPSNLGIFLKSLQIKTDSSVIYGSGRIRNLEAPEFSFSSNMKLRLGEFRSFLPDSLIKNIAGGITANITVGGNLDFDSIPEQINDLVFNKAAFRFDFDKVSMNMADTLMQVEDLTGQVQMRPDTIRINSLSGLYKGIDFSIDSTKIANLYNTLILNKSERLYFDGRIKLGDLDYTMFAPFLEGDKDTTNAPDEESVPSAEFTDEDSNPTNYTFLIKGKLGIKSFSYNKVLVDNISARFNLRDSIYIIDQFRFHAIDGKHNTSFKYVNKGNEQNIYVKNSAEGLNVVKLLKDFDNFKEYYEPAITYENISGILSSKVDAQVLFRNDSLIQDKLYVRGEIKLKDGGVYNYPPVKEMARYLPGVDNLDKLEFKTINTNVFVFQNAVYVPSTLIVSNKLDANALGMQSFGEDYAYHFIVFLGDIITGKSDRKLKKQDAMGEEISIDGRKGTMVKSYSLNGKSRSGLDNKKDRKEMERKVKASETLLNLRFHPNLVNYDTGVK